MFQGVHVGVLIVGGLVDQLDGVLKSFKDMSRRVIRFFLAQYWRANQPDCEGGADQ